MCLCLPNCLCPSVSVPLRVCISVPQCVRACVCGCVSVCVTVSVYAICRYVWVYLCLFLSFYLLVSSCLSLRFLSLSCYPAVSISLSVSFCASYSASMYVSVYVSVSVSGVSSYFVCFCISLYFLSGFYLHVCLSLALFCRKH